MQGGQPARKSSIYTVIDYVRHRLNFSAVALHIDVTVKLSLNKIAVVFVRQLVVVGPGPTVVSRVF